MTDSELAFLSAICLTSPSIKRLFRLAAVFSLLLDINSLSSDTFVLMESQINRIAFCDEDSSSLGPTRQAAVPVVSSRPRISGGNQGQFVQQILETKRHSNVRQISVPNIVAKDAFVLIGRAEPTLLHFVRKARHDYRVSGQLAHVCVGELPHLGRDGVLFRQRLLGEVEHQRIVCAQRHAQAFGVKVWQGTAAVGQEQAVVGERRHGHGHLGQQLRSNTANLSEQQAVANIVSQQEGGCQMMHRSSLATVRPENDRLQASLPSQSVQRHQARAASDAARRHIADPTDCRALKVTCHKCGKTGHFAKVCRSARTHFVTANESKHSDSAVTRDEPVFYCGAGTRAAFCDVKINRRQVKMEKDSGASCSLISRKIWEELGRPPLKSPKSRMLAYDGHVMKQLGILECLVETGGPDGRFAAAELPVIECEQKFGLLGRDLLSSLLGEHPSVIVHQDDVLMGADLRDGTRMCALMKRLQQRIRTGRWGQVSQVERPYKACREALSVEDGGRSNLAEDASGMLAGSGQVRGAAGPNTALVAPADQSDGGLRLHGALESVNRPDECAWVALGGRT
uniref:CCHC-type domain-containing protein n=1 Tax=Macrostomum lignano TaxID=282301 RepID=A0A1I8HQW1_9PLAT